jgi:two-component system nitrogen regulation response regulator GlnG
MADDRTPARLLLIDDEPAQMAEQIPQAFPTHAYRAQVAGTGQVGLEHVRAECPDVIVLGLSLPDQCGLEVYRQIRAVNARVPVIFVTRSKRADAAIEAMKHGAYDCLFKPLDLPLLRRVVGEALDVARRMRRAWRWTRARKRTRTDPSSAPVRPWPRCTRPSAGSPPRTCRC